MKDGKKNFFWASYADLMTSLFFIMLVLYVLTFIKLRYDQEVYRVKAEELDKIREIEKSINQIDSTYFKYNTEHKKHILNISVKFNGGSSDIFNIPKDIRNDLVKAGNSIVNFIGKFKEEDNIKYLVIIEGQASKDGADINDRLSYERALSLIKFWRHNKIDLRNISNCELIIAGSGEGGVPREQPDYPPKNQRFLIHIIPKTGKIGN